MMCYQFYGVFNMEEPIDFRTINGLSVGFNILDRSKKPIVPGII